MKIKTPNPPVLKEGDKRIVVRFAFLPTSTDKGETYVWLEKYLVSQTVQKNLKAVPDAIGPYGVWLAYHNEWVLEWVDEEKTSIE